MQFSAGESYTAVILGNTYKVILFTKKTSDISPGLSIYYKSPVSGLDVLVEPYAPTVEGDLVLDTYNVATPVIKHSDGTFWFFDSKYQQEIRCDTMSKFENGIGYDTLNADEKYAVDSLITMFSHVYEPPIPTNTIVFTENTFAETSIKKWLRTFSSTVLYMDVDLPPHVKLTLPAQVNGSTYRLPTVTLRVVNMQVGEVLVKYQSEPEYVKVIPAIELPVVIVDSLIVNVVPANSKELLVEGVPNYVWYGSFNCLKVTYQNGIIEYYGVTEPEFNLRGVIILDNQYVSGVGWQTQPQNNRTQLCVFGSMGFLEVLGRTNLTRTAITPRWTGTFSMVNGVLTGDASDGLYEGTSPIRIQYEEKQLTADTRTWTDQNYSAKVDLSTFTTTLRFKIFASTKIITTYEPTTQQTTITKEVTTLKYPRSIYLTSVEPILDNNGLSCYSFVSCAEAPSKLVFSVDIEDTPTKWQSCFQVEIKGGIRDIFYPNMALRFVFEDTAGVQFIVESSWPIIEIDAGGLKDSISLICPRRTMNSLMNLDSPVGPHGSSSDLELLFAHDPTENQARYYQNYIFSMASARERGV